MQCSHISRTTIAETYCGAPPPPLTACQTLKKQQDEHDTLQLAFNGGKEELQGVLREMGNVRTNIARDNEAHKKRLHAQFQTLKGVVDSFTAVNGQLVEQVE